VIIQIAFCKVTVVRRDSSYRDLTYPGFRLDTGSTPSVGDDDSRCLRSRNLGNFDSHGADRPSVRRSVAIRDSAMGELEENDGKEDQGGGEEDQDDGEEFHRSVRAALQGGDAGFDGFDGEAGAGRVLRSDG